MALESLDDEPIADPPAPLIRRMIPPGVRFRRLLYLAGDDRAAESTLRECAEKLEIIDVAESTSLEIIGSSGLFDAAFVIYAWSRSDSQSEILKRAARSLTLGGLLGVIDHASAPDAEVAAKFDDFYRLFEPRHRRSTDAVAMMDRIEALGFDVVEHLESTIEIDFTRSPWFASSTETLRADLLNRLGEMPVLLAAQLQAKTTGGEASVRLSESGLIAKKRMI